MSVFSFRQAGIVWVKECWDAFRDRRTLLMIILPALIAGPLFLMIIFQVLSTQNERAVSPVLHVQGEQYAPALIAFLKRQQVQIMPLPQDYEHQIKRGDIAIAMIVPPQFPEEVQKGDAATVHLLYDRSRDRAQVTIAQVERLIYAYSRQWGQLRLLMRGVATEVAQPITVRVTDYATPQQSGALILSLVAFY
ncbi:MAG: ABC transporter permease, partial [Burkholderiales bacterium]|nr:ABC transporter permease [Burkholderiales bacterium]